MKECCFLLCTPHYMKGPQFKAKGRGSQSAVFEDLFQLGITDSFLFIVALTSKAMLHGIKKFHQRTSLATCNATSIMGYKPTVRISSPKP